MTQKSGDFEVQKHTFSDHQKKHGFKATNICGPDGEILATTDLSGAISPAHGDNKLISFQLQQELKAQENQMPKINGLSSILKSTDAWFPMVVAGTNYLSILISLTYLRKTIKISM